MILDGVDVFAKVVEAGGFSAAARQLGMPATTVSAKIARLEGRLGVTLIRRSTRRMHVTAAGMAYYERCAEALRTLADGEAQLASESAEPTGLLRLTASPDVAQSLLPNIVEQYLKTYPRVSVELIVTNAQLDLVAEGVDLALRASQMRDSALQSRRFGAVRLRLYASQAYLKTHGTPKQPGDLEAHQLLVHSRFPKPLFLTNASGSERYPVRAQSRVTADDMQTLRALAERGLGIAVLSSLPEVLPRAELVEVMPGFSTQTGTAYFVYPAGKFTPIKIKAFIDLAVREMRAWKGMGGA